MRTRFGIILVALLVGIAACGGYGGGPSTAPDGLSSPPAGATVIDIVGINGSRSFSPNPASIPAGQMDTWHNVDVVVHRVVFDNVRVDTGDIGPGRFTGAMTLPAAAAYHCSIHPEMVGTVVNAR